VGTKPPNAQIKAVLLLSLPAPSPQGTWAPGGFRNAQLPPDICCQYHLQRMFSVCSSNIWGHFYPASCAAGGLCGHNVHGGCCSLPGKVLVAQSRVETKLCGTNISRRKEQRGGGTHTFEKLFLHVRKQMMILLMLPVLFTALFLFKVFS